MKLELVEPQKIMIDHLRRTESALLFCGMGLSKTAAVLYHLNRLFLDADSIGALVVAPLRVANLTWPSEVRDWDEFQWMRVANLRTELGQRAFLEGSAHIYTINYEGIQTLVNLVERRRGKLPFDTMIFDELTKAKNPGSKRINLLRRKVPRVERNIGLTGTPLPNSWLDLFAQVRLVDGGERLGTNFLDFKRRYFVQPAYQFAPWKEREGAANELEKKIADITCTLKSSDWLNIPDTVFEDVELHFDDELKRRYRTLETQLVIELRKDKTLNVANAATLVTKLLQFTSGHMYDDERDVHPIHNLKFDALRRIAAHEKQPLLVACIFQHEQQRIREQFPEARFFADAKNENTQRALLDEWNAGKIRMLVAHPASVGHGLNLQHGSSVMIWISLTYSRELYEQMIARLARRGQKDIVRVYRLLVSGTADEAVVTALENKAKNEQRLISALQMLEAYRDGGNK